MGVQFDSQVQWFPGHMAKTRRLIRENLAMVDIAVELLDARIPQASRNPEIDKLLSAKPRMILMTKSDAADPAATEAWLRYFQRQHIPALAADCRSGKGLKAFAPLVRSTLSELLERRRARGLVGKPIRLMIVGIPNVGKSSLINRLAGGRRTQVADKPGVTRSKQWITVEGGFELLDTPGVLWPKFEDEAVGDRLAFVGSIRDEILDLEGLAVRLLAVLQREYPALLTARYKTESVSASAPYELLQEIARLRGMRMAGGEADTLRCAVMLLDEFRAGKIGRVTLERPPAEGKR